MKARILQAINNTIYKYWVNPLQNRVMKIATRRSGWLRNWLLAVVLWLTNLGRLLITRFQISVISLKGSDRSAVYVGMKTSLETIKAILFPSVVETYQIKSAFIWQLPSLVHQLLKQYDVVVYEQNFIFKWMPQCEYAFSASRWVRQMLDISQPMDAILEGMNQNMRRNIRKMEKRIQLFLHLIFSSL